MAGSPENTHELLIRDQERLRALARGILGDSHAADDVMQEAWLVATTKPRHLENAPAWLRTVTRNLALRRLRSAGRRRAREQEAARGDQLPSTVERVEAIELRRRLLDAVESLGEPYRSTVVSRYLDDLSPSAIARQQGIPVKTVKTRLTRALAQLRRKLDQSHGERRAWALPLGAVAWPHKAAATTFAANLMTIGGVAMAAKTVVVSGILIVVALGVWAVVDRQEAPPESARVRETPPRAQNEAGAALQGLEATDAGPGDGAARAERNSAGTKRVAGTHIVSGILRFADEEGKPVKGVELHLQRIEKHPTEPRWTPMTTREDGSFRTPSGVPAGRVRIVVRCTGIASYQKPTVLAELELGESESEGLELLLPWTGRATIRVLDANESPIIGASVALFPADSWNHRPGAKGGLKTGANGTVVIAPLPADQPLVAVARAAGHGPVRSKVFSADSSAGGASIVLHAAKGARVHGRVERADGSRAANVLVSVSYGTPRGSVPPVPPHFVHTDEDGLFEMVDVAAGSYQFRADLGGTTAATEGQMRVAPGDTVEVHLRPAAQQSISGVVVDEDGKAWTADRRSESDSDPRGPTSLSVGAVQYRAGMAFPHRVPLDEEGRFEVKVPTGTAYRLGATSARRGFATSSAVEVDPGASDVTLVWTQPHARLLVEVLDAGTGKPLEGAEVVLSKSRGQQTTTTRRQGDSKGEVRGPWLGAGTYHIFVFAAGHCYDQVAFEVGPAEKGDRQQVVRLGRGRTLRGRVEDNKGRPVADRRVGILLPGAPGWFETSLVATDEHGVFTIGGLRPSGGRVALYNENGDTRAQVDASGDDVVIVARAP